MKYSCPVCAWPELLNDPSKSTYEICDQCGTEFGYDAPALYPLVREAWEKAGKPFWYKDSKWREDFEETL